MLETCSPAAGLERSSIGYHDVNNGSGSIVRSRNVLRASGLDCNVQFLSIEDVALEPKVESAALAPRRTSPRAEKYSTIFFRLPQLVRQAESLALV